MENVTSLGLPWWLSGNESACRCRRHRFRKQKEKNPHSMNPSEARAPQQRGCTPPPHHPTLLASTREKPACSREDPALAKHTHRNKRIKCTMRPPYPQLLQTQRPGLSLVLEDHSPGASSWARPPLTPRGDIPGPSSRHPGVSRVLDRGPGPPPPRLTSLRPLSPQRPAPTLPSSTFSFSLWSPALLEEEMAPSPSMHAWNPHHSQRSLAGPVPNVPFLK